MPSNAKKVITVWAQQPPTSLHYWQKVAMSALLATIAQEKRMM